jgi:hypothetical protein
MNNLHHSTLLHQRDRRHICASWLLPLLLLALPAAVPAQFTYTTNNGTITITGYTGPSGAVYIPDTINGLPVTSIGDWAFYNGGRPQPYMLTSITIPDSVTSIGLDAFAWCLSLSSATLGNGLISIGQGAFAVCGLTSITIPNSVTTIGDLAFQSCFGLTCVTIGNGVTSIGQAAFECCGFTNVTIPSSVINIGGAAFDGCSSLTGAYFQGNAPSADSSVFQGDHNIVYYTYGTLGWGPTYGDRPTAVWYPLPPYTYDINNGTITITRYIGPGGAVTIPSTINGLPVTSIGEFAFFNGTNLTSVNIPNGVTNIGDEAFEQCTSLTTITIPDGVTSIGIGAFLYCTSLTSVTIPNGVTSIGDVAFGCSSLTNVTIPNSVTSIGYEAFGWCVGLTAIMVDTNNLAYSSVAGVLFNKTQSTLIQCPGGKTGAYTIPNGVTSIGDLAFYLCTSLTNVTIPNSVTSIGNHAFWECTSLTTITIPSGVTSIGNYTFCDCTNLTGVYFQGNAPSLGSDVFNYDNKATVYYLPGTTGWGTSFGGRPTAPWYLPHPVILDFGPSFGVRTNGFGFVISWATNLPVVVEAATDLANPNWSPLATNTLTNGSSYFSDPQWTNYPARFYRLRSP